MSKPGFVECAAKFVIRSTIEIRITPSTKATLLHHLEKIAKDEDFLFIRVTHEARK
jgi:hypothetical protein